MYEPNPDGTGVLTLTYPIQFGPRTIVALTVGRRPQARDVRGRDIGELSHDDCLAVMHAICNEPPEVLALLDLTDLVEVVKIVAGFFGGGARTTGGES